MYELDVRVGRIYTINNVVFSVWFRFKSSLRLKKNLFIQLLHVINDCEGMFIV